MHIRKNCILGNKIILNIYSIEKLQLTYCIVDKKVEAQLHFEKIINTKSLHAVNGFTIVSQNVIFLNPDKLNQHAKTFNRFVHCLLHCYLNNKKLN